jgi:hypothetical protein
VSVTKTEVYTILRDVCIVSNRLTVRWKYWRNRCARQCLPPPLFVTQKGCRSEFQNAPIKSFTSMFVLLPWLRYCIWLIGYGDAVPANCSQHENCGKIKITIFLILIGPNPDG